MLKSHLHFKSLVASTALLVASLSLPLQAKTLTIALDLSGSNPLLIDKTFNQGAVYYVSEAISALKQGDEVNIQTFGDLRDPTNFKQFMLPIKRHNAKKVARQVAGFIASLPNQQKAQGSTNLIAWFGRNQFGCSNESDIIVLTDGIEASEYVDPNKLLNGTQALPKPNEFVALSGCRVTFYGLGVGRRDKEVLALRRAWQAYFTQAGATFTAVIK